jgi:phage shock protein A
MIEETSSIVNDHIKLLESQVKSQEEMISQLQSTVKLLNQKIINLTREWQD